MQFKSRASLGKSPSTAHGVPSAPGTGSAFSSFSIGRKCSVSKICRYGILASPSQMTGVALYSQGHSLHIFGVSLPVALAKAFFFQAWSLHYNNETGDTRKCYRTTLHNSACLAGLVQQPDKIWSLSWMKPHYSNSSVSVCSFLRAHRAHKRRRTSDEHQQRNSSNCLPRFYVCVSPGHPSQDRHMKIRE